ncbi:MAG: hypothetical protein PHI12_11920 [Dehalococcoidales bacterium]|nr:hypothetical protein [Dehalococcoidales bacterium]
MSNYRVAFAYTRTELLDKLEEQLVAALNHHYLLSLLKLYGFTHYLLKHWTNEYEIHIVKTKDVLLHKAKISNAGKLRALQEIEDRVNHYDDKLRDAAVQHFLGVFGDVVGHNTKKIQNWLTTADTDAGKDAFWAKIYAWADANLKR